MPALLAAPLSAGEPAPPRRASFATKPRVSKPNGKYVISFAAASQTDCAVYILNSSGRVVRHLAAGVLGAKAPAPLKKGLVQELSWDGKDDNGRPASGGPFKVRVALGLRPAFEKTIGDAPGAIAGVAALAVNPANGELHVFNVYGQIHPSDNTTFCAVYDSRGKYLRTIMPYSNTLPDSRLKGAKRIDVDGRKLPYVYQGETRSLLPGLGHLPTGKPCVARDGRVAFIGHHEFGTYNGRGTQQVVFVNADGSPPDSGWTGPVLAKSSGGGGSLAITAGGGTLYATGIVEGRSKTGAAPCVYKFAWGARKAQVFVGDEKAGGGGKDKLSSPRSVSLDGKGNVYVADRGNGRIVAFKPDGSYLGEVKLAGVDQVEVHRKTGAIYATAGGKGKCELVKFASIKASAPACRTKLPMHKKDNISMLALDPSGATPVIWYSHPRNRYTGNFKALRIEDKGGSFGDKEPLAKLLGQTNGVGAVTLLSYNRVSDKLLINRKAYDPVSGKLGEGLGKVVKSRGTISDVGTKKGMGSAGLDGNLYLMGYSNWLRRLDPDLGDKPFPGGKGQLKSPDGQGTLRLRARGVTADAAGNVYAMWQMNKKGPLGPSNYLAKHSPDGKVIKARLIDCQTRFISSPRLDTAGNIYVALCGRPAGKKLPASFKGQDLGKGIVRGVDAVGADWYELLYGCILKFGPEGGSILRQGGGAITLEYGRTGRAKYTRKLFVKGAKWAFHGASPVPGWEDGGGRVSCGCESPQFDVDGFGRSFFPDALRFRCGVVDTGGNQIGWFGAYGNADAKGKGSEIPMLWPYCVATSDSHVYVGDRLNRRVVAVKIAYAAEETCPIRP